MLTMLRQHGWFRVLYVRATYRRSVVLNLLTITSWSFVSLFVSLALVFFCVLICFRKLVGVTDPTGDCSSTTGLETES